MLEGKAIIDETDMLQTMQQDALHLAAKALDIFEATELTDIARFIKKVRAQRHYRNFINLMDFDACSECRILTGHVDLGDNVS
ncbi:hypothetical protein DITRI_Ditri19aG0028100 [Diplodiscus trichospermus]